MPKDVAKYTCCMCGKDHPETSFYKSYSDFYINGKLPICKSCFSAKFWSYFDSEGYKSTKKAMQRMCMAFDIPFVETLLDELDNENEDALIGNYFRKLNMVAYKGKTFDDTIDEGFEFSGKRLIKKETRIVAVDQYGDEIESEYDISEADIKKWGAGFEPEDYMVLNNHYKYLKKANPNCDGNQEVFIIDLCHINMLKTRALRERNIDDYQKLVESYRKSFNQAGLKTSVEDAKTADDCWSVWTGIVSQYTPEEYYKNKDRYKDFDGLDEYFRRHLDRPLKNIRDGTQVRDIEFYVHDNGDDTDD